VGRKERLVNASFFIPAELVYGMEDVHITLSPNSRDRLGLEL
jgi:hypothetical protein